MRKSSFTLIEMLIVVVIIGILAAALIPRLQSVQARARDTKRKADLHQIATALEIYKEDNGNYKDLHNNSWCQDNYIITDNQHFTDEYQTNTSYNSEALLYVDAILGRYMTSIPTDPTISSSWTPSMECFDLSDPRYTPVYGYLLGISSRHGMGTDQARITFDAVVLAARTESDGSSSNRVTNTVRSNNSITGADGEWQGSVGGWGLGTTFGDNGFMAQTYNDYMCSKVEFTGGNTYNDGNGNCEANQDGDALRYIYVQ